MYIINPEVKVEPFNGLQIMKNIERACRVCFSEDTEILTDKGWKNIKDVQNDLILTYNPKKNSYEYEASNLLEKEYNGNLLVSTHSNIAFKITPDHRIFYTLDRDKNRENYRFGIAEEVFSKYAKVRVPKWFFNCKGLNFKDYNQNISHTYIGEYDSKSFSIDISDELLYILGAYIAEGHINNIKPYLENKSREKKSGVSVQITQNENNILYTRTIQCLDRLQWSYRINCDPRKPKTKWIIITGGLGIANWFREETGYDSYTKHLPNWFRKLSVRQLNILKQGLYDGDGSHCKTRTERYLSVSQRLLDEMQELHILIGQAATKGKDYVEQSLRDSWLINPNKHIKKESYNGKVYCTQTQNGIVCIRLNNKTVWIGNCYRSEDRITDDSYKQLITNCIKSKHESVLEHEKISIYLICDIGVYKELTRHRIASFSIESTRYCNYSKGKFGSGIHFIEPLFVDDKDKYKIWFETMAETECCYNRMAALGAKPDELRMILPHSTAAEVAMTANIREWRHILSLRTAKAAHPAVRQLMIPLLLYFKEQMPELFNDISYDNTFPQNKYAKIITEKYE